LRQAYKSSPNSQFFNDPAMKPFKEKFISKLKEEFLKPLEHDLDIRFADYTNLVQGQITFAVTQNGWTGGDDPTPPGLLFLLDAKDASSQLKTNLANFRKKFAESGKSLKTEKIRGVDFSVLQLSSNDMPKTLSKFFPPSAPVQELGSENQTPKSAPKNEFVIGQVDSLLIMGNSVKEVEKVVIRLGGGSMPTLGESAAYAANHRAMLRDAPIYGWVNVKAFLDLAMRKPAEKSSEAAPEPMGTFKPEKVIEATGLGGVKTLAFTYQSASEGSLLQFFVGAPEASRQGLFKIIAGEPKDSSPPAFIPADAVKFQRWRLDGQKIWAALEKMVADISPQTLNALNFLLDAANTTAREKEPGFDIRKNLIGNLGDDLITYQKAPRGSTLADLKSAPSMILVGSPNPEQLAASLKSVLSFMNQQGGPPAEREFLGRKIFSMPLPALPLPIPAASKSYGPRTLNYAASGSYVALSTDAALLEEFLRSSESQAKTLRETAGLIEASQKVTGPGTGLFGYDNQAETMRATFETWKKSPSSVTNSALGPLSGALPVNPAASFAQWLDFSLLPPFEKVAKYFSFRVYGGSANVDGLTLKVFSPTPPLLKNKQ
jgi:hypothetical protein